MSLYQKYRPTEFGNVHGQEHVKKILQQALSRNLVAHAYLFYGPRGTGKTTCARLIAKSLNCLDLQKEGNPCNKCDICLAINGSSLIDVIEIDAASNRGIDEMRELKETIKFLPTQARNKVYIIDEVHMLTTEAFNALLKTLEEPPENVYFILATTEIHKVPETILSRCQRFDFKRIANPEIVTRLKFIAKAEKLEYDDEALELIAIYSNGGLRDAISLLDQIAVTGKVTADQTKKTLGSSGIDSIMRFLESLLAGNDTDCLQVIANLKEEGLSFKQFQSDLMKIVREKLHQAVFENSTPLKQKYLKVIELWQEIQTNFHNSSYDDLALEVFAVKYCLQGSPPETTVAQAPAPVAKVADPPEIAKKAAPVTKLENPTEEAGKADALKVVKKGDLDLAQDWKKIIDTIKVPVVKTHLKATDIEVLNEGEAEVITYSNFAYDSLKKAEVLNIIEVAIADHTGNRVQISLKLDKKSLEMVQAETKQKEQSGPLASAAEIASMFEGEIT